MKRETETDRMLKKLDMIINTLSDSKQEGEGEVVLQIKQQDDECDEFGKYKNELRAILYETETLLNEMEEDNLNLNSISINTSHSNLENVPQIENNLKEINRMLIEIESIVSFQKTQPNKFDNVKRKEEMKNLMEKRFILLTNISKGKSVDINEINNNRAEIEKINEILSNKEDSSLYEHDENRKLIDN
jgi:hypothetical protein